MTMFLDKNVPTISTAADPRVSAGGILNGPLRS